MSVNRLKYIFPCILALTVACDITRTIDYDTGYSPDKIVVTGFIGMDNRAEVFISTSHPPLSMEDDSCFDAEVLLFEDGEWVGNLTRNSDCVFVKDDFSPKPGKSYSVTARINGFPEASSEPEILPSPVRIDSVQYFINTERELYLTLYFKDPPDKNYYSVKFIRSYNDTLVAKDYPANNLFRTNVFEDKLFDSREYMYERKLSLRAGVINNKAYLYNHIDVILYSITESGYVFFKSLDESDYTNGDMFAIPAEIQSNIYGGYGIFAAYSTDTIKINLDI